MFALLPNNSQIIYNLLENRANLFHIQTGRQARVAFILLSGESKQLECDKTPKKQEFAQLCRFFQRFWSKLVQSDYFSCKVPTFLQLRYFSIHLLSFVSILFFPSQYPHFRILGVDLLCIIPILWCPAITFRMPRTFVRCSRSTFNQSIIVNFL